MGLERAHAQLLGQGQGLAVVTFGRARTPEAHTAPQCRRGAAGHTPRGPVPGAHGRAPAPARQGRAPPPGDQPAAAPPPGRDDRVPGSSWPVVCSIACVSSGMALATRPARIYAAPKATAIMGNKSREVCVLAETHGPFEQGEGPRQVALAEGQQTDPHSTHASRCRSAPPPRQSGGLRPRTSSPRRMSPARHGPGRGRHGRTRQGG